MLVALPFGFGAVVCCEPNPFVHRSPNLKWVSSEFRKEDIVIVGAGIAELATAVSLHRLGVGSLVLEQADSLRTGGTSLTLFKNGWRVLDAIGVGSELRTQFLEIQGMSIKSEDGKELRSFKFKDEDESQEVRAVERRILLETLANQLPPESVHFSSKLANIETTEDGETILELTNGTRLHAKEVWVLLGCGMMVDQWFLDFGGLGGLPVRSWDGGGGFWVALVVESDGGYGGWF
ncbi:hypothetical protein Q3G72_034527 [Acer saccharum]|nr:hypothetical protein Q3G72_034527 [Acer saccharum]